MSETVADTPMPATAVHHTPVREPCDASQSYRLLDVSERRSRKLDPADLAEHGAPTLPELPLDLVDPNPNNPRRQLQEIALFADNIREFGLLQPITVRRVGERYELIGGHRRRAAFAYLQEQYPHEPQWRAIPAVIVKYADDQRATLALISSQVHTRNWNPREEAAILEQLYLGGLTQREIGERLHKTEGWASKRLRVYSDSILSGYVQSGRLQPSVAEELLTVADLDTKKTLAEEASRKNWTRDQLKGRIRALRLDRQLRQIGKLTSELLEILSAVESARIPIDVGLDLNILARRIDAISGRKPVRMPTIAQAERAAHVPKDPRKRQPVRRTKFRAE